MIKFKTAYSDYVRVSTPVIGESLTKQSEKDACDINLIVSRYMKAGYDLIICRHLNLVKMLLMFLKLLIISLL